MLELLIHTKYTYYRLVFQVLEAKLKKDGFLSGSDYVIHQDVKTKYFYYKSVLKK